MRTLIKGASIATVDKVLGDIPRGDILIEDDKIVAIDSEISVDAQVIDASSMIAMPGLVDTHRHTWQTGLRGLLVDHALPGYLRGIRLQMAPRYRPEDMYAGNYVGALDAINCGVTTLIDYCHNTVTPDHAEAALIGFRDAGIRSLWGLGLSPIIENTFADASGEQGQDPNSFEGRLKMVQRFAETYFSSKDQLLTFGVCPQETLIAPLDEIEEEMRTAREHGARIVYHANQICVENLFKDVEHLAQRKLLADDMILIHCTFNTDREWELMEEFGVSVGVCPETEMQMGMGFPPIVKATQHTYGPGIAIDCVSGTAGDIITEARLVLQALRYRHDEPGYAAHRAPQDRPWTTKDALRWATLNGAHGAGLDHKIGSLTPGKQADIVLLDASGVSMAGWNREDPTGMIISHTNSGNVDTVMIAGRILKQNGRLVHVDPRAAVATLDNSREHLMREANAAGGFIPEPLAPLPMYDERA
jgi:cytosine/adenosine deaminase-related metal-dependent hydrolase